MLKVDYTIQMKDYTYYQRKKNTLTVYRILCNKVLNIQDRAGFQNTFNGSMGIIWVE